MLNGYPKGMVKKKCKTFVCCTYKWDDISIDDEKENDEQTNKETDTDVSEDEEEIMTSTPIGPPIKSDAKYEDLT